MLKFSLLYSILFITSIVSISQNIEWTKAIGGGSYDTGLSISIDNLGNVYTIGYYQGTSDFDPGEQSHNITAKGGQDIFISKLNANGDFLWAKSVGGSSNDVGYSIATDAIGNVYASGSFQYIADFNTGEGIEDLRSSGSEDIFILKLGTDGVFKWAKKIGSFNTEVSYEITTDNAGNIYATGLFYETTDFNPNTEVYNLVSNGNSDVFILKLTTEGNLVWAKNLGGTSVDYGKSVAVDGNGNVYTTGFFKETIDVDPGTNTSNLTSYGDYDAFISKLDANGDFAWGGNIGGEGIDQGTSIATTNTGEVYTAGKFQSIADVDPGLGVYNLTSAGQDDIFITKLSTDGNLLWAKQISGFSLEICEAITTDIDGNVYLTGHFMGTVDFDPSELEYNIIASNRDVFILKLAANGDFVWAKQIGGPDADRGYDIVADASSNLYITGDFRNEVNFSFGENVNNLTPLGKTDAFISKISQCTPSSSIDVISACSPFLWIDDNIYTESNNTATFTLPNAEGCDSVVTLELTINSIDKAITIDQNTVTANTTGASYQWLDCGNGNSVIPGANAQTYTATNNGSYSVILEVSHLPNNCTDTSTCFAVSGVGIDELGNNAFSIYPNPSNGNVTIEINSDNVDGYTVQVMDNLGQIVLNETAINASKYQLNDLKLASGVYFVEVRSNGLKTVQKLIIR